MEDKNTLYVIIGKHCPPCNIQHEILNTMDLQIDVVYCEAEDSGDLIEKYALRTTPSMIFNSHVIRGLTSEDDINEFISEYYKG